MNASQTQYTICGNNNTNTEYSVNINICRNNCAKDCNEIHYSLEIGDKKFTGLTDSIIKIKYKSYQQFHYNSDKKYSFVDFLSNIGGLIGLWFGMSFIGTSALIRLILNRIKVFINVYNTLNFD